MEYSKKLEQIIEEFQKIETNFSYDRGYEFENIQREDSLKCCNVLVNVLINELSNIEFNYDLDLSDEIKYWNNIKKEIDL